MAGVPWTTENLGVWKEKGGSPTKEHGAELRGLSATPPQRWAPFPDARREPKAKRNTAKAFRVAGEAHRTVTRSASDKHPLHFYLRHCGRWTLKPPLSHP